ncbi:MAG: hypothetical protein AAFV26_00985 [Pseudomonadota bacterium]
MIRPLLLGLAALSLIAALPLAAAAEHATLTRVEPRPFYGATITLEAGVRVFRTLPSTRRVIINPGHKTQLNLSDTTIRETRTINQTINDNRTGDARPFISYGGSGVVPLAFGKRGKFRRGKRRARGNGVIGHPVRRVRRAPRRHH